MVDEQATNMEKIVAGVLFLTILAVGARAGDDDSFLAKASVVAVPSASTHPSIASRTRPRRYRNSLSTAGKTKTGRGPERKTSSCLWTVPPMDFSLRSALEHQRAQARSGATGISPKALLLENLHPRWMRAACGTRVGHSRANPAQRRRRGRRRVSARPCSRP